MLSIINPKPADDPHDVLVVASDAVLMAPTDDELSRLARLHHPVDPRARTEPQPAAGSTAPPVAVPSVDTTFRPAATGDVRIPGRRRSVSGAARAFLAALLLAVGSGAAAMAWQSYGGTAEQMIARWAPSFAPPAPAIVAATAANPAQAATPVQAATEGAAPAAAAAAPVAVASAEPPPSRGAVTNDIAGMRQEIDQLKSSIEELKAGQQQISRDVAKASEARVSEAKASDGKASDVKAAEGKAFEQNVRSKLSAHSSSTVARPRRSMPPPPRQAAAYPALPPPAAYVPRQVGPPPPAAEPPADPELASVPRPPMPLR